MSVLGLGLLVLVGATLILTGLPAFAVLIFAAVVGALCGLATGEITLGCLAPCPGGSSTSWRTTFCRRCRCSC